MRYIIYSVYFSFILLDLNELLRSLFGLSGDGVLSIYILLVSFILYLESSFFVKTNSTRLHRKFIGFVIVYLTFGVLGSVLMDYPIYTGLRRFLPGFLVYYVSYKFFSTISWESANQYVGVVFQTLFSISSLSIILSFLFNYDIITNEFGNVERSTGLYSNPNRAGNISVVGQVLTLFSLKHIENGSDLRRFLMYILHFIAALFTFSKTAFVLSFFMLILYIYSTRHIIFKHLSGAVVLFVFIVSVILISINFFSSNNSRSNYQNQIFDEFSLFLSGEINETTTTGRSNLAEEGINLILNNIIIGYGIGSFTSPNAITSKPVHNMYLGIWGEAGIFALLSYLYYLLHSIFKGSTMKEGLNNKYQLLIILVLFFSFTTHDIINFKPFMVLIALVNALAVKPTRGSNFNSFQK